MLLAGDIGGTKADLALYSAEAGPRDPLVTERYSVAHYDNLESLVATFLRATEADISAACFGVAGPVVDGQATGTNLPWTLSERSLSEDMGGRPVHLLNDLEAIAYGVPMLSSDDVHTLSDGIPEPQGAIAIIAPGTGLGTGYLVHDGQSYSAYPSEGGHSDFAPNTALQCALWRYLHQRYGHVSCERVCSGVGIPNLYAFLRDSQAAEEPSWLAEALATVQDPTPIIVEAAQADAPCPICQQTLDLFIAILGSIAGDMALTWMATGGVYLGGGIPPRILPQLLQSELLQAFWSKGRLEDVVRRMPLHVITHSHVGRLGAAAYGLTRMA